jgi:hypothetical protein
MASYIRTARNYVSWSWCPKASKQIEGGNYISRRLCVGAGYDSEYCNVDCVSIATGDKGCAIDFDNASEPQWTTGVARWDSLTTEVLASHALFLSQWKAYGKTKDCVGKWRDNELSVSVSVIYFQWDMLDMHTHTYMNIL